MPTNIDMVRRIYSDGLFDDDVEGLLALVDPGIEFVNPAEAVESGVRRGPAAIRAAVRSARESFAWSRHELGGLFGGGDRVVAVVTFRARGHGSGAELSQEEAHTWTFREGRILRFEWGRDLPSALAAAGLTTADGAPDNRSDAAEGPASER
ncbi:MAG: nuclear transport factor 2 family protein [Solirubrobacterales bacterium]|nr:nuclear transport factor 2 family protein [Solirubrobacterales bacterium]